MHTLKGVQDHSNHFSKAICFFLVVKLDAIDLSRVVSPLVEYGRCLIVL